MCHFPTIIVHFFLDLHPKEGRAAKLQAVSPCKTEIIKKDDTQHDLCDLPSQKSATEIT